ncbi:YjbF family lipoprotein, partial [Falsiroseomonas oryziterrae]|uniref:YjbF family lipoprotein n=1 Tax=Falsiroseomonas oryziterrae TaxID=2911368 RepID=UPI001F48E786
GGDGGVAVATDGPRVVGTAGLGPVLMATRLDGPDPLADPRALLGREASARRTVDLGAAGGDPNAMRFGLVLDCRLAGRMDGAWLLVEERCAVDGRSVTNRFWADPATGAVRRSEQWAGDAAPLVIEAVGT